jgi:hypothetical protein
MKKKLQAMDVVILRRMGVRTQMKKERNLNRADRKRRC